MSFEFNFWVIIFSMGTAFLISQLIIKRPKKYYIEGDQEGWIEIGKIDDYELKNLTPLLITNGKEVTYTSTPLDYDSKGRVRYRFEGVATHFRFFPPPPEKK